MKKNVLSVVAVLALFAAIFFIGLAGMDGFTAYEVHTKGSFHGIDSDIPTTLYQGTAALVAAILAFFAALRLARLAVKVQYIDQHPKSTIRSK